jgi:uncharacterized protein YfiM (DUF2279 family)
MGLNHVIRHDRTLHYFYGSLASLVGIGVALMLRARGIPAQPAWAALSASAAAAAARECWNVAHGDPWSWADFGWTVAGGIPAASGAAMGYAP